MNNDLKILISNCCGAVDRIDPISELKYSEIEICPQCQKHCEFIDKTEQAYNRPQTSLETDNLINRKEK